MFLYTARTFFHLQGNQPYPGTMEIHLTIELHGNSHNESLVSLLSDLAYECCG